MLATNALILREERDQLGDALQALSAYQHKVRTTHFPEAVPPNPSAQDELGDPLRWLMQNPPRTPTPTPPPPPTPPPSTTPLPACSYEKEWMDLDSERSEREYKRLFKLYKMYLGRGEEGLINLWRELGGSVYWRTKLRPSQLTLLLSREVKSHTLRFRVGRDPLRMSAGDLLPIDPKEIISFCSFLLPRLPCLRHLMIIDAPVWPFDFKVLDRTSYCFPELQYLHLPLVRCTAEEVIGVVQRIPTLVRGDGVWVDEAFFEMGNDLSSREFKRAVRGRVTVRPEKQENLII